MEDKPGLYRRTRDRFKQLSRDEHQAAIYRDQLAPNMPEGTALAFAHGLNIHFKLIEARNTPLELMHTHNFKLEEAALAIETLAGKADGPASIHSCLLPVHATP